MSCLNQKIEAAERDKARRSYASAISHFEVEWKGLRHANSDTNARYLADHAETLAINTLCQRLAVLSRWHVDQGFPEPTKSPLARQALEVFAPSTPSQKSAHAPLELAVLQQVDQWLDTSIANVLRMRRPPRLASAHTQSQPHAVGFLARVSLRRVGRSAR